MDCVEFEALLFRSLDVTIAMGDRHLMLWHRLSCTRCRHLAALVEAEDAPGWPEYTDDLTTSIVAITSGRPCGRAQLLLADADEAPGEDDWLLAKHLETCPDCTAVVRAFARMKLELPGLAEPDPGESFTAAAVAAVKVQLQAVPTWRRIAPLRILENLLRRPRVALEGSFASAMLLLIVFGLPSPSLSEMPLRVVDAAWRSVAAGTISATSGLDELNARTAALLHRAADRGTAEAREHLRALSSSTRALTGGVWYGLFAPGLEEIRSLWNEKTSGDVESDTNNRRRR